MDDGLKQRLVGAVVLAALAVIFLPSLFNEDSRRRVDTRTQVPASPGIKTVEIQDPVRPQGIPQAKPAEQMYQMLEPDAEDAEDAEVDDKPVASRLNDEGVPLAWVVQVASFKSLDRAEALRDELLGEGYKAFVRTAKTSKGPTSRVFVGPKLDKQRALAIKEELDREHQVESMVLKFRP